MKQIEVSKVAFFVVLAAIVCSLVTCVVTMALVGESQFKAGFESGKGQLSEATTGQTYELKIVGMKDGKAHEVESSYGYSVNNQSVVQSIPANAKVGDSVVCVTPREGIQVLPRR